MSSDQFSLLIIVLLLGFGGYFAHPILNLPMVLLVVIALLAGGFLIGLVMELAERPQRERDRLARRQEWIADVKHDLWRAQQPNGPYWQIDRLTKELKRLEGGSA